MQRGYIQAYPVNYVVQGLYHLLIAIFERGNKPGRDVELARNEVGQALHGGRPVRGPDGHRGEEVGEAGVEAWVRSIKSSSLAEHFLGS